MREVIQVSCLGNMGRFGNQLWQYAFAKAYAEKHDCELQIPHNWIGRQLFKFVDEPAIVEPLPRTELDYLPTGETNIDLYGFYQHQKFIDVMDADKVRNWFTFKDEWEEMFPKVQDYYIAAHMRRGDYTGHPNFCTISVDSFRDAVNKFGHDESKVVPVAEEFKHPSDTRDYSKNKTYYENIDFLFDFFLVRNADVIFRSNSTFSWWAAFLAKPDVQVYSPMVQGLKGQYDIGVEFVEGNWPCHMEIDDRHSDIYFGTEIANGTTRV